MRRLSIAILFVTAVLAFSQTGAQEKEEATPKSLLWRITGKDMPKPSYLFGTMDFICLGDYVWTPAMADCFAKSDKLCLPVNLDDSTIKKQALQALINTNGKKTEDYVPAADREKVSAYMKDSLHVELKNLGVLKPVAIQPMIIKKLLGCPDAVVFDIRLLSEARDTKKEIVGIETLQEEMQDIDASNFNDKIIKTLTQLAGGSTYFYEYRGKMMAAYKDQDIRVENELLKSAPLFSPADLKVLLDDKNTRYVSRMPAMMKQGPVFFAFNSINLAGKEGLIAQLRKAGYTVEPVR